jgi:hypothetical protein
MFAHADLRRVLVGLTTLTTLGALGLASATPAAAQGVDAPGIRDLTHHIRTISPQFGPAGTMVRVHADNLPPNARVQVAVGEMQGCGYQVCEKVQTNGRGELTANVQVPEWAHTTHYEVIMILAEDFMPIAVSDPFHVTDAEGMVTRTGTIGMAWPGCPSLIGDHGVTYAIVGPNAMSLMASQGHRMELKGRVVEGVCAQGIGLDVESMEMVPDGW